jgi:hypothetical protein
MSYSIFVVSNPSYEPSPGRVNRTPRTPMESLHQAVKNVWRVLIVALQHAWVLALHHHDYGLERIQQNLMKKRAH